MDDKKIIALLEAKAVAIAADFHNPTSIGQGNGEVIDFPYQPVYRAGCIRSVFSENGVKVDPADWEERFTHMVEEAMNGPRDEHQFPHISGCLHQGGMMNPEGTL